MTSVLIRDKREDMSGEEENPREDDTVRDWSEAATGNAESHQKLEDSPLRLQRECGPTNTFILYFRP